MIGEIDLMPSFRSKFEANAWKVLIKHFPKSRYEPNKLSFLQPAKVRTYVPDFKTGKRKIYIEAKGKMDLATRQKMIWFRQSNPLIRIVFLFMNPDVKINKRSKTSYGKWASDNHFEWLDFRKDWINDYKKLCRT